MKKIIALFVATLLVLLTVFATTSCSKQQEEGLQQQIVATEPDYTDENGVGYKIQDDGTLEVTVSGAVTDVVIPSEYQGLTVTAIGKSTFKMTNIKTITLPDTIKSINDRAFAFCDTLETIVIPDSVESIGMNAFAGCFNIKSINLPKKLKTIGKYAFNSVPITEITIPKKVELIDEYAFSQCAQLRVINILSENTAIAPFAFNDISDLTIKAPNNSLAHTYAIENNINFVNSK